MEGIVGQARQTLSKGAGQKPVFCLYISGATPKSTCVVGILKPVLDGIFKEGYDLRVVDVYQDPPRPGDAQITAVPMLTREYPLPVLRILSDFSSAENIRRVLNAKNPQETLGG